MNPNELYAESYFLAPCFEARDGSWLSFTSSQKSMFVSLQKKEKRKKKITQKTKTDAQTYNIKITKKS